jgi:hypothetical protein
MEDYSMQNRWYGDECDLVKWGTIIHLAGSDPEVKILHVVMMRPDDKRDLSLRETDVVTPHALPEKVLTHFCRFRCVQDIVHLDKRIVIYDKLFPGTDRDGRKQTRADYFGAVRRWIRRFQKKRRIVLIDPDTGIKAGGCKWRHVKPEELECLYDKLSSGDTLILYQHGCRQGRWVDATRALFPKGTCERVRVFQCRGLTSTVALFAVNKS